MGVQVLLKQSSWILSTYTADVSGVASALYEMGGMTVIHDASGCNSTYNTHDEPRWYDMPSMVYISALAEMDAVLGADDKLIADITKAANDLHPRFIAIAGTPIPMMMGTDFSGIARVVEKNTGIPTFGFETNSMHSYVQGADVSLAAVAERFCRRDVKPREIKRGAKPMVNLLGVTPLDFSITGNVESMKKIFTDRGYGIIGCWAMGSPFGDLERAGEANVNVVVSSCGLSLARTLRSVFGTPYVIGAPVGVKFTENLLAAVDEAAASGKDITAAAQSVPCAEKPLCIVGEAVVSASIREAMKLDFGISGARVICPLEEGAGVLGEGDVLSIFEEDIFAAMKDASSVMGDPMVKPALPSPDVKFISFPHEGCSGRTYRSELPIFVGEGFNKWISKEISKW